MQLQYEEVRVFLRYEFRANLFTTVQHSGRALAKDLRGSGCSENYVACHDTKCRRLEPQYL